ncbi:MAG: DUF378 domain-containing protein [Candidatus Woesearchaeota archaeon]
MAKKGKDCVIDKIAMILVIVGALNWGLVALNFNLVTFLFRISWLVRVVYGLVGISALWMIYVMIKNK